MTQHNQAVEQQRKKIAKEKITTPYYRGISKKVNHHITEKLNTKAVEL
tara:strand:+ start:247 stop:390 length:144 start_codon:yes stop_codon:yes gene_type:complete